MHLTSILIASTLIRCQVSTIEMHDLVQEFKDENDGIISSLNLNYENSLLNPMIGEPYKHTGLLSNLRFFGPGIISGSIAKTTQRSYPNDKSNHPLIQFIIMLFPSPAGTLNHLCTHPDHLTKLFVEINSTDKIENASDLLVCSITGERFEYSNKGHEECIKRLKEEKAKLENGIDKNEVEAINEKIFNTINEKKTIEKNLRVLNKQMGSIRKNTIVYTVIELESLNDNIKESQYKLKRLKGELEGFKKTLSELLESKGIEELNKKIKLNQEIEEKRKSAFEDLGTAMSKALKNKKFLNPQLLLPMIIHEFVKSAFTIGELKEYMHKSLIKIEKKVSEKSEILNRLRVGNTDVDWAAALVRVYITNSTFPYSKFNQPVSNISIPSYIRGKDGEEGYFDEKRPYADCAEIGIMQLCNCLLFNPKTKTCDLSHLGNAKLEPELKDFYQKHSNPFASTTLEKRNDWSKVVQDRRDLVKPDDNDFQTHWIIYNRDNRNEIDTGFTNMMSVLALIFGIDRKAIFDGLDERNILKRFKALLKAVAIPGMSVEIDKADSGTLKVGKVYSRTELFGKVLITFSYKHDRENESRTTMSIEQEKSHTAFNFVQNNSKEIDLSNEIELLGNSSLFTEFSLSSMISRVFLMASEKPLPKGNILEDMYASGLVESNEKKLEMLKIVYENMPKDENEAGTRIFNSETPEGTNEWDDFIRIIDSILENVPLEDPEVFYSFAPFLLHSEKHKEKLNDMNLRLIIKLSKENVSEHWIKHANQRVATLRCSFIIDEINNDKISKEIAFCQNFSNLSSVELIHSFSNAFTEKMASRNAMQIFSKIPNCTEVTLNKLPLGMIKCFVDFAVSNPTMLMNLGKLKINLFCNTPDILYINSSVDKLPSVLDSLKKLSEITIENRYPALPKQKRNILKSENLAKMINELPFDRNIVINFIGNLFELKETPEFFKALKATQSAVKVFISYNINSFNSEDALTLMGAMECLKLDIKIFHFKNGIRKPIPTSIEFLDNIIKAKNFQVSFNTEVINVEHISVAVFLSSFDFFLKGWEWDILKYVDLNPSTDFYELVNFLNALSELKAIRFESKFLNLINKDNIDRLIAGITKRGKPVTLSISTLLIESVNIASFCVKIKEISYFTLEVKSWLIRVKNENIDAFIQKLPEIYNMACPEGNEENEFLSRVKALSDLDLFTIDLMKKDVVYICDENFDKVLKGVKTIASMFKEIYIFNCAFNQDEIKILQDIGRSISGCTLEISTEESLWA
ncbi:hypothetical protein GINT2_001485 [Glugoides intestinalis]